MNVGDRTEMVLLRDGDAVGDLLLDSVVDVVVVEFRPNGKVLVEDAYGPQPRRQWVTDWIAES